MKTFIKNNIVGITIFTVAILITIYIFYIMKNKKHIVIPHSLVDMDASGMYVYKWREVKKKSFYDQVSTFLFGAKSFKWGELKGL